MSSSNIKKVICGQISKDHYKNTNTKKIYKDAILCEIDFNDKKEKVVCPKYNLDKKWIKNNKVTLVTCKSGTCQELSDFSNNPDYYCPRQELDRLNQCYSPDRILLGDKRFLLDAKRVFEKYNIKNWWLDAGSLMGPLRFGSFINWDDDIDTCILWDELKPHIDNILKDFESEGYITNISFPPGDAADKKYDPNVPLVYQVFWEESQYVKWLKDNKLIPESDENMSDQELGDKYYHKLPAAYLDIFPFVEVEPGKYNYNWKPFGIIPMQKDTLVPPSSFKLFNKKINIPRNPYLYLNHLYGNPTNPKKSQFNLYEAYFYAEHANELAVPKYCREEKGKRPHLPDIFEDPYFFIYLKDIFGNDYIPGPITFTSSIDKKKYKYDKNNKKVAV